MGLARVLTATVLMGALVVPLAQRVDFLGSPGAAPSGALADTAPATHEASAAEMVRPPTAAEAAGCTTAVFWDVSTDAQFCSEIVWLASTGVARGYPDTGHEAPGFHPRGVVTRQSMAAFLHRFAFAGTDDPECTGPLRLFSDVRSGAFCGSIEWLAGSGITTGKRNGTFGPVDAVTRQSMAAFLYRLAHRGAPAPACRSQRFWDIPATSLFCPEIAWLADSGLAQGSVDPGHALPGFHPTAPVTRQAMAAFLYRADHTATIRLDSGTPLPTITGVSPGISDTVGGGTITITGSGLSLAIAVTFDRPAAAHPATGTELRIVSDTEMVVTVPSHSAGIVPVRVATPLGMSVPTDSTTYTYGPSLSIVAGRTRMPSTGSATAATVMPRGLAVDAAGNVYIADTYNSMVEKVTPAGLLTVIAGTGEAGFPTPGPATVSAIGYPQSVAVDAGGNVYIADAPNNVVEKVNPDGILSIAAGTGDEANPAPGPAVASPLASPEGVAVDAAGNLYIADSANRVVEKVSPDGILTVVAGSGTTGNSTPGEATSSALIDPVGIAIDGAGSLYIADTGSSMVVRVSPDGVLAVVAGTGTSGRMTPGPATASNLAEPTGVAVDTDGNVYVVDGINDVVAKIDTGGELSIVAGGGTIKPSTPGPATDARLFQPGGVAVDTIGNLYVADTRHGLVEKVTPDGVLAVIAGTTGMSMSTPGPATASALNQPDGVAVDAAGNVFIADTYNNLVEKVTPKGVLSIVAGSGIIGPPTPGPATASALDRPSGVAVDVAGNLYIADASNGRVEKVTPDGVLLVVAGNGGSGAVYPGPATARPLGHPAAVVVDPAGNLYIADTTSGVVEKVTPAGMLSIVAGRGTASGSAIDAPNSLALDAAGNLYIADGFNSAVLKVNPAGNLSIVAGNGGPDRPTPGPATSSALRYPAGLAVDAVGNLYIADTGSSVVARVAPDGILSIVAGSGRMGPPAPGPATFSALKSPVGLAVDAAGDLYLADSGNDDILRISWR